MYPQRWAVVLAGGEGTRMRAVSRNGRGQPCPKQYSTFVGTRSMLQHTLDRARQAVTPDQIVTVIGKGHWVHIENLARIPGRIFEQPCSRDTAAGVFLALTCILAVDPDATVLVLPSDHFVYPESLFVQELGLMLDAAERFKDRLILLGAKADSAEIDYGWIQPGRLVHENGLWLRSVESFSEKPSDPEANLRLKGFHLWNTMVISAKASLLWAMGKELLPRLVPHFSAFRRMLQAAYRGERHYLRNAAQGPVSLEEIYARIESASFSVDFLRFATARSLVLQMNPAIH